MTVRLIPYSLHAALELLIAIVTMAAPFVLGFSVGPAVATVALGALLVGLALSGAPDERGSVSLPLGAHRTYDEAFVVGFLAAGAAAALLAGDTVAALALAGLGIAELALGLTTRYSLAPPRPRLPSPLT